MQRIRLNALLTLPVFFLLCLSDTALGQTLTITDTSASMTPISTLALTAASGNTVTGQFVIKSDVFTTVTARINNDASGPFMNQVPPWLRFTGNQITIGSLDVKPSTIVTVVANTQNGQGGGALATGTYNSTIFVSLNNSSTGVLLNVSLTVNGGSSSGVLVANPNSINFSASQGSNTASPSSQNVQITTTGAALGYNLTIQYVGTQLTWVNVNPTTGTTGGTPFSVSASPSGLATGTYNATILVSSQTTSDSVSIPLTLTVGSVGSLTVSPANPPPFLYQIGGASPAALTFTVSAGALTNFSISPSVTWLFPSNTGGAAGPGSNFTFTLTALPAGLPLGTSTATVTLQPFGGVATTIPISLLVSNNPLLTVSPTTLTFAAGFATGQSPADQNLSLTTTGTGSAVGFTVASASDQGWLSASASQSFTPATLTVHVATNGLAVGTYTGTVTIRPSNGDNYSLVVPVTLSVGTSQQINVGPPTLLFSYQTTKVAPGQQFLLVQSTGQPVTFTTSAATTNCGTTWLSAIASSTTTPANITVGINTVSLPSTPGTCTGTITVTPSSGNPSTVPVAVTINTTALLTIGMQQGFGFETVQQGVGTGAIQRLITVGSTDPSTPLTFSVAGSSSGGNWLTVGGTGNTPQNVTVVISPGSLGAGVYGGTVVITSASLPGGSLTIPVQLTVTPNITVAVSPSSLSFTQASGGAVPAQQTISLTSSGSGTPAFIATVGGGSTCTSLLTVSPGSGTVPGSVAVNVVANSAAVGVYNCQITFSYQNSATLGSTVPVTLTITQARTITASVSSLTFSYQLTQPNPASQKVSLASSGGAVNFTVGTISTPSGWLSVDTSSGTTPKDINVSVNPAGLAAGQTYTGQVQISAPGVLANPITINVSVAVTAAPNPLPGAILSTASNLAGTIAAGELITIKGTLLGPTTAGGVLFSLNGSGGVNSTLSGVRVLFDGIPGTPIFVSATQINVIVPWEVAGRLSTNIVIEYQSIQSSPISVRVADSAPGLFTLNQAGNGQVAAVNQNGTFNGPGGSGTIPAAVNTVVVVYGTGGGVTSPGGQTGSVSPTTQLLSLPGFLSNPKTVSATVAGLPAVVEFAGAAPALVSGVNQFNIRIPLGTPSGAQQIVITINGISSPFGATIAVQ